jgi:YHS domain-containing protein
VRVNEMASDKRIDPVCGMEVAPEKAAGRSTYIGAVYYFCSLACKQAFEANPTKYLMQK